MRTILAVLFGLTAFTTVGQGFNNNEKIDQEDLKVLFRQSRLTPFKFSFLGKGDSTLNIIIEQYVDGQLTKTRNFYEDTKGVVNMSDEPKGFYYPALNGKSKQLVRLYFDENNKDTLRLWVHTATIQKRFSFPTTPNLSTQIRAFDDIPAVLNKKQPLVVFYGNEGFVMSCPGDAEPLEIAKMYKVIVVIYAEPVRP